MRAQVIAFGEIEIDGRRFNADVVIDRGAIRSRDKAASKRHRERYGHTPLSLAEGLPWGGSQLIVGTGVDGRLPIMPEVLEEARRRRIEVVAVPTAEACRLVSERKDSKVRAVLHVTC